MYCKHCGQQIDENSKYCSYCGILQKAQIESPFLQFNVNQSTMQKPETVFSVRVSKKIIGFYLIWFLFHFILLLTNWKTSDANEHFYPFSKYGDIRDYDLTEFLFYTLIPLIALVIFNLFKKPRGNKIERMHLKYDMSFRKNTSVMIIGILLLLCSLVFLLSSSIRNSIIDSREELSAVLLIFRIAITFWAIDIAEKLNRSKIGWGIFAFFLPSISLIFLGQKRKLKK
jgi:hypothetical protein